MKLNFPVIRRRNRESGAALIEFAFVLMPTLGCMFLLMQLAWMVFAYGCVQEGVREGVRAAINCTPSGGLNANIQSVVEQYSFGFVNPNNVSSVLKVNYYAPVTLTPVTGQVNTGDVAQVTVSNVGIYSFAPILGWGNASSKLYVGATSADVMSCYSPATP